MNKILNTLKLLRKPISTAERVGVPKVIRNQRIKPNVVPYKKGGKFK